MMRCPQPGQEGKQETLSGTKPSEFHTGPGENGDLRKTPTSFVQFALSWPWVNFSVSAGRCLAKLAPATELG